jgi:hypothetical protein
MESSYENQDVLGKVMIPSAPLSTAKKGLGKTSWRHSQEVERSGDGSGRVK